MKKILKWTGILLLLLVVALVITVYSRQHLTFEAPYPDITASPDSAVIARGAYLVNGPAHCTGCHTDKRGPMLWEHAPVRENCATCHDPHGSSNDRMLVVRMPMLCQRCHIATKHPSSIYDNNAITVNKSNRMFGRSCMNCHQNIHGSNHPSGQFFMR